MDFFKKNKCLEKIIFRLSEGMTTLKEWRETGVRRSEEVVEIWEHVLSRSPASLSDQLWLVYEQVKLINKTFLESAPYKPYFVLETSCILPS